MYTDKLTWTTLDEEVINVRNLPRSANIVPFVNDKSMVYTAFFADFGPLDLGLLHKWCTQLHETLLKAKEAHKTVIYYSSSNPHAKSNSAVLLCGYMV